MNIIYVFLGIIFMSLGSLGVILPVLPTTPFLLLALACFTKGSKRFSTWFIKTSLYKNYLDDFIQHRSMSRMRKIVLLSFSSSMLLIAFLTTHKWHVKAILIATIIYLYYYFIVKIKTAP